MVFVSSAIEEFLHERKVVEEAIAAIPLTRSWVFEHSSAYAEPVAEAYLRKVRECDIFILLVGEEMSEPVKMEYQTAVEQDKPRLVFLKDLPRAPEADSFIRSIDVKWAKFSTIDELRNKVQAAVADELIRGYRRYRLKAVEVGRMAEFGERLSSVTVVRGDQIQVSTGDVSGQIAVGSNIVQTLADFMLPLNTVLSAFLLFGLSLDLLSICCAFSGQTNSMCPYCNLLISGPAAFFGLLFSVLTRNRMVLALSLALGGLAILALLLHVLVPITGARGFWPLLQPICLPLLFG